MPDVVCIGLLVADVVGKPIDSLPERGRLALIDRIELHTGGCAANTGVALAKLGVSTALIGKVGKDGFGDFIASEMVRHGLQVEGVVRDAAAPTSATMVTVDSQGERSFLHCFGANAHLGIEDVHWDIVGGAQIVHLAGALLLPRLDGEPAADLLRKARALGTITSLDTAWDATGRWFELVGPLLPYVDYFLPSLEEARMLAGGLQEPEQVARFLLDAGVGVVGLKMGSAGSYFAASDGSRFHIPIWPANLIDSLGAGDAYVAGFLAGLARGWSIERSGRLASVTASHCVGSLGATTGVRSFDATYTDLVQFERTLGVQA